MSCIIPWLVDQCCAKCIMCRPWGYDCFIGLCPRCFFFRLLSHWLLPLHQFYEENMFCLHNGLQKIIVATGLQWINCCQNKKSCIDRGNHLQIPSFLHDQKVQKALLVFLSVLIKERNEKCWFIGVFLSSYVYCRYVWISNEFCYLTSVWMYPHSKLFQNILV